MEFVTTLIASLAVAAVFYQLGFNVGKDRGARNERFAWKEGLLPIKIDEALRDAYQRISIVLWHLRDELHNLPQEGGSLPYEEAYFLRGVYCNIPAAVESMLMKNQVLYVPFTIKPEIRNVLIERYAGKMYFADQELKTSDFDLAEQGNYAAAIFIAKAILSKHSLYRPATN